MNPIQHWLIYRDPRAATSTPPSPSPQPPLAGAFTESLESILMIRFGSLAINVVVLAHISDEKISSNGVNVFGIAAPGRLSRRGPAAYGEVYRAYTLVEEGGISYLWQTQPSSL